MTTRFKQLNPVITIFISLNSEEDSNFYPDVTKLVLL